MQAGEMTAQDATMTPSADDTPLVFQFSKSQPLGISSLINKNRLAMAAAFAGSSSQWISGHKRQNTFRSASAILGLYANIIELIFSSTKPPSVGELALTQGQWEYKNGDMVSYIRGEVPERAQKDMERLLENEGLPNQTIELDYDKARNRTSIRIPHGLFPALQETLHHKLSSRQQAFSAITNSGNWVQSTEDTNGHSIKGINLDGLDNATVATLKEMLENDFDIHSEIVFKEDHKILEIDFKDRPRFMEISHPETAATKNAPVRDAEHIRVRSGTHEDYNPGFVESLTRPDKHPKQHGILVGAILSNALRIGAGFKKEKVGGTEQKAGLEALAATLSMISYVIDYQPEVKSKTTHIVAASEVKYGAVEEMGQKIHQKLNENPTLTSLAVKLPITAIKMKDAANMKDSAKMFSSVMNGVRALITATLNKGDYGR